MFINLESIPSPQTLANKELAGLEAEELEAMELEHCQCSYFRRPSVDTGLPEYWNRIGFCMLNGEFYAPHRTAKQDDCYSIRI